MDEVLANEIPNWLDWIGALSPAGLLGLFVLFVFTGRVIPKNTVAFLAAERDSRLQQANEIAEKWQRVAETSQQEAVLLRQQQEQLLEHAQVTVSLLQSIKGG
jgi:hypothetical protein